MLSDSKILWFQNKRGLVIEPFHNDQLQPASYDVRLGEQFKIPRTNTLNDDVAITPGEDQKLIWLDFKASKPDEGFILEPGEFILGTTIEYFEIPEFMVARFEGKSTLGRSGLMTHVTAGFIDPGYRGRITLELKNVNTVPIRLILGMRIGQVSFSIVDGTVLRPYGSDGLGSRYQDALTVVEGRKEI